MYLNYEYQREAEFFFVMLRKLHEKITRLAFFLKIRKFFSGAYKKKREMMGRREIGVSSVGQWKVNIFFSFMF